MQDNASYCAFESEIVDFRRKIAPIFLVHKAPQKIVACPWTFSADTKKSRDVVPPT